MPMNQSCRHCASSYLPRGYLTYGKKCPESRKINQFKEVHRYGKDRAIHDLEQEPDQNNEKVNHVDTVNISSVFFFNNKHSAITTNLRTLSNQASITVPYKVGMGSDGNIMPLHTNRKYFLGQQKNNWQQPEIITSN